MLIRPTSTEELSAAIKAMRSKARSQDRPLKMRATRPGFATMHSMPCASQPSNPSPFLVRGKTPMVVGIMMDQMTRVLSVDQGKKQIRVQAQMTLKGLYEAAAANQMSTPRSALPWWQGLTLGGIFSTSSHGTGLNATSMLVRGLQLHGSWSTCCQPTTGQQKQKCWVWFNTCSAVAASKHSLVCKQGWHTRVYTGCIQSTHLLVFSEYSCVVCRRQTCVVWCAACRALLLQCDWFVDVTWVDATGTVRTSAKGSDEARALCGGLGLLGTLTEFTLQMTETTNTWFSTW